MNKKVLVRSELEHMALIMHRACIVQEFGEAIQHTAWGWDGAEFALKYTKY